MKALAERGIDGALRADPALAGALNTYHGGIAHPGLAESTGAPFRPFI